MRSKDYAYLLGVVAIFAGLAVAAFGSSRLIDLFGGAVMLSGLGVTGWVAWGRRFLRRYIGVLLAKVLICAVIFLVRVTFGR
jgi:hypothetical protein